MADTHNQAEVKRRYPVTSGITAGTTKQEDREMWLIPEDGSLYAKRKKAGLNGK